MLRKQMFPHLRPQETFVAEAKMFLNLIRNILLPQQMFPRLRAEETFRKKCFDNNVSSFAGDFNPSNFPIRFLHVSLTTPAYQNKWMLVS